MHMQYDLNLLILHIFEGIFSFDLVHIMTPFGRFSSLISICSISV